MDTREMATEYRLAKWAQLLQAKAENRQSIQEFCECEGVSRNTYFYWQRKLREATVGLAQIAPAADNGLVPNGWMQLTPAVPGPAEAGITIEVGGCRVTATAETNTELLTKVCRMLKAL